MSLKEEELKRAKEVSLKVESELKEIMLKHTSVMDKEKENGKIKKKNEPAFELGHNCSSSFCRRLWRREMHCRSSSRQKRSCLQKPRR